MVKCPLLRVDLEQRPVMAWKEAFGLAVVLV